jgi:dTDP-glucose 4,6-dehydratase
MVFTHDLSTLFCDEAIKKIGHIDYILNIASDSHVDRSISDPVPFVRNNINVALTMLELARKLKPKLFLQFSTDEVYGVAPFGMNHKEWSPIVPSNPYSASKAAQEAIAISYWRTYGVPLIITNTMNLFGETQDAEKFIAKSIRAVLNNEKVTVHGKPGKIGSRFYLHARNMADAVLYILNNLPPKQYIQDENLLPDRYNIVGDVELNNLEMAQTISEICGKELSYDLVDHHTARPGHDYRYALDGGKLRESGWKAPLDFKASLKKYIDWTLNNKTWL